MTTTEPITWHDADGQHVGPGGDVGGDYQAGESYSVRYVRDDQPLAVITEYYYASVHRDDDDHVGPFYVERQVEYMTLRDADDPGSEEWSETDDGYQTWDSREYETLVEADAAAKRCAESSSPYPHRDWDGIEPDAGRMNQ